VNAGGLFSCHIDAAKKPRFAARKIGGDACLQFASRLGGDVNVRAMQESRIEVKCFTRQ
jgi:hypothetical protein